MRVDDLRWDVILCQYCGVTLRDPEKDISPEDTADHKCVPMLVAEISILKEELETRRKAYSEGVASANERLSDELEIRLKGFTGPPYKNDEVVGKYWWAVIHTYNGTQGSLMVHTVSKLKKDAITKYLRRMPEEDRKSRWKEVRKMGVKCIKVTVRKYRG